MVKNVENQCYLFDRFQSIMDDIDNWWESEITETFALNCLSIININWLIFITCQQFLSIFINIDFIDCSGPATFEFTNFFDCKLQFGLLIDKLTTNLEPKVSWDPL